MNKTKKRRRRKEERQLGEHETRRDATRRDATWKKFGEEFRSITGAADRVCREVRPTRKRKTAARWGLRGAAINIRKIGFRCFRWASSWQRRRKGNLVAVVRCPMPSFAYVHGLARLRASSHISAMREQRWRTGKSCAVEKNEGTKERRRRRVKRSSEEKRREEKKGPKAGDRSLHGFI